MEVITNILDDLNDKNFDNVVNSVDSIGEWSRDELIDFLIENIQGTIALNQLDTFDIYNDENRLEYYLELGELMDADEREEYEQAFNELEDGKIAFCIEYGLTANNGEETDLVLMLDVQKSGNDVVVIFDTIDPQ